jgi:septum formation inhibitor-activating ATPase MinD
MAKVLVVTSGKGGVGKTTTTAALGAALAQGGQKVVVVDFDVGLRNLDLVMGRSGGSSTTSSTSSRATPSCPRL